MRNLIKIFFLNTNLPPAVARRTEIRTDLWLRLGIAIRVKRGRRGPHHRLLFTGSWHLGKLSYTSEECSEKTSLGEKPPVTSRFALIINVQDFNFYFSQIKFFFYHSFCSFSLSYTELLTGRL